MSGKNTIPGGFVGIACNVILSGAKIALGIMISSIAITADARCRFLRDYTNRL